MVVNDVGQMVGRVAVGFEQHQVVEQRVFEPHVAAEQVVNGGDAGFGNREPDHGLIHGVGLGALLLFRQVPATPVIAGWFLSRLLRLPDFVQPR